MINELKDKIVYINDLKKDTKFKKTAKAEYPGSPCAFRAVAGTLPLIKNSYALMICLYNAKLTMSIRSLTDEPLPNNLLFCLISDNDIIFGISDKIKAAIKDICEKYNPGVLFVVTTCLQEIIGEDFDSMLNEIQMEGNSPLLGIHTENFTCDSAAPGLENVSLSLLKLMKKQNVEEKSVNILGLSIQKAESTEIVRFLRSEGIIIKNIIPLFCTPKEIEKAPAAKFNLVMQQYSLPLAKEMKKHFGTEYIYFERPYTPDEIENMYKKIADALKINVTSEIQKKKAELDNKINLLRTEFKGKSCVIGMFQGIQIGRYYNFAELVLRLGMDIKGMILRDVLEDDWEDIKKLSKINHNIPIIDAGNAIQNELFLKELNPDYFIGNNDKEVIANLKMEIRSLMSAFRKTGFEVLEEILKSLCKRPSGFETIKYKEQFIKKWEKV